MLELAADLLPRLRAGERIAVVTVTRVSRSAPRGAGASMAVTATGEVIGSISGGCVEEDAVMLGLRALSTGSGQTAGFGFSDADAHAAGLACGGAIDVVAYPLDARRCGRGRCARSGAARRSRRRGPGRRRGLHGAPRPGRADLGRRAGGQHPDAVARTASAPGDPRRGRLRRRPVPRGGRRRDSR